MSKPIFIIRHPAPQDASVREQLEEQYKGIGEKLSDYHVLFTLETGIERAEFECFNSSQVPETTIEELKSMVLESFKK